PRATSRLRVRSRPLGLLWLSLSCGQYRSSLRIVQLTHLARDDVRSLCLDVRKTPHLVSCMTTTIELREWRSPNEKQASPDQAQRAARHVRRRHVRGLVTPN